MCFKSTILKSNVYKESKKISFWGVWAFSLRQRYKKIICVSRLGKFLQRRAQDTANYKENFNSCSQGLEPNSACKDRGEERMASKWNSGCSCVIIAQRWPTKVRNRKRKNENICIWMDGCFRIKLRKVVTFLVRIFLIAYAPISMVVSITSQILCKAVPLTIHQEKKKEHFNTEILILHY